MDPPTPLSNLSILSLANPFLDPDTTTKRDSSSSNTAPTTPALIAADLAHYKDLFTKLRFSYVEQVTKERFLRVITSDPPEFVDARENAELEQKLAEDKAALKARKEEVASLIKELEVQGRNLANRYEHIHLQQTTLQSLPSSISNLESTISHLRQTSQPPSTNPDLNLPLHATNTLLSSRSSHLQSLASQIATLQSSLLQQKAEEERLRDELAPLQAKKIKAVQEAQEARRRRELGRGGGVAGEDLDERGRYLREVEGRLRGLLEV